MRSNPKSGPVSGVLRVYFFLGAAFFAGFFAAGFFTAFFGVLGFFAAGFLAAFLGVLALGFFAAGFLATFFGFFTTFLGFLTTFFFGLGSALGRRNLPWMPLRLSSFLAAMSFLMAVLTRLAALASSAILLLATMYLRMAFLEDPFFSASLPTAVIIIAAYVGCSAGFATFLAFTTLVSAILLILI